MKFGVCGLGRWEGRGCGMDMGLELLRRWWACVRGIVEDISGH